MERDKIMKNDTSTFGDWAFLIGGIGLIGGWIAYENADAVHAWLVTLQAPATAAPAPTADPLSWLIANWGIVLLIGAIIFAVLKMRANGAGASPADGGHVLRYKRHRYLKVKLV